MDTTVVKIGIPGIGLVLSALFVYATWVTGRGLDTGGATAADDSGSAWGWRAGWR